MFSNFIYPDKLMIINFNEHPIGCFSSISQPYTDSSTENKNDGSVRRVVLPFNDQMPAVALRRKKISDLSKKSDIIL